MSAVWVALGGAAGALSRWWLGLLLQRLAGTSFPLGTLVVNALGCLCMGLVLGRLQTLEVAPDWVRPLLVTGLLGGFTTYSAFAFETQELLRQGALAGAALNVGLQLVLGLSCVAAGRALMLAWR